MYRAKQVINVIKVFQCIPVYYSSIVHVTKACRIHFLYWHDKSDQEIDHIEGENYKLIGDGTDDHKKRENIPKEKVNKTVSFTDKNIMIGEVDELLS